MKIRPFQDKDWKEVKIIHEKYHEKDFPMPQFLANDCIGKYVVEDNGKIILAGSLHLLVEAIVVTDVSAAPRQIHEALSKFLTVSTYESKFYQLHCTVFDPKWMKQLVKRGFQKCKGVFLYYNI
jgi:hypothetical protein